MQEQFFTALGYNTRPTTGELFSEYLNVLSSTNVKLLVEQLNIVHIQLLNDKIVIGPV